MLKFNFKCLFIIVINKALFKTMRKLNTLLFTSLLSLNYLHAQIEYNSNSNNDSINFFDKLKKNNSRIYQSPKIEKIPSIYFNQTARNISVFKIQLNTLNNSRKSAKEVLIYKGQDYLIKKELSFNELIKSEVIPNF